MDNPPWDDEDVSGFEENILVDGYETRHQGVHQSKSIVSTDQGRATKASGTTTTITSVKVKVGRHYSGLHCRLSSYNEGEQFNLGDNRLMKLAHFILVKNMYSMDQMVVAYVKEIVQLIGAPFSIKSDQDQRFH